MPARTKRPNHQSNTPKRHSMKSLRQSIRLPRLWGGGTKRQGPWARERTRAFTFTRNGHGHTSERHGWKSPRLSIRLPSPQAGGTRVLGRWAQVRTRTFTFTLNGDGHTCERRGLTKATLRCKGPMKRLDWGKRGRSLWPLPVGRGKRRSPKMKMATSRQGRDKCRRS